MRPIRRALTHYQLGVLEYRELEQIQQVLQRTLHDLPTYCPVGRSGQPLCAVRRAGSSDQVIRQVTEQLRRVLDRVRQHPVHPPEDDQT